METGQQGAVRPPDDPAPIPVVPRARQPRLPRILEVNRRRAASAPSPTKGISRAFDSQEATQRLMRQIGADGRRVRFDKSISGTSISRDRALRRDSVRGTARKRDLRRNGGRGAGPCDDDRPGVSAAPRRRPARGGKMTVF